jgi:RHS repeat-associated protein
MGTGCLFPRNAALTQLVGPSGTTTFGYDNNGNTTSMTQPGPVVTNYGYDYEDRLVSVANPSYTAAYAYSADGLRLRVQESNNPNPDRWMQSLGPEGAGMAAQRVQPYDGVRPVLEGTLSGDTFTTLNKYVWEGNGYYDPLMYSLIGGAWRYHMYDGLGSTRQLMLHSDQSITDTYSYEAFGNLMSRTGSTPSPYQYVGALGYYQTGGSLQQLGLRYYMPEVGRFMQQDPIGAGMNWHAYVGNDPVALVDPEGLCGVWLGPWHLGDDRPWLVFDDSVGRQLGWSAAATARGVVRGGTLFIWQPNWTNPLDPYRCFSRAAGTIGGVSLTAAAGVGAARALGVEANVFSRGNVFKVISRRLRAGFRLDKAVHGRWGHPHIWRW